MRTGSARERGLSIGVASVIALVAIASCTLTTDLDGISGGTRDGGVTPAGDERAVPPARPAGEQKPGGGTSKTLWLGVKHFHFAHSNDALKVPGAWQDWGYDLDGRCTGDVEGTQQGTCIRSPKAFPDSVRDGKACRDNNLGSQLVPQLNIYNDQFENDTNKGLETGAPAWILRLEDVGDGKDDPYVPGTLYLAAPMPEKVFPAWDGTDARALLARKDPSAGPLEQAIAKFPAGFLRDDVWVSGEPSSFDADLPIGLTGELMPMPIVNGVITFRLNEAHTTAIDGTGMVAGAIPTSALESFVRPFILTQTAFCPGTPQYTQLVDKLPAFADVVVGAASLQDPGKSCDGMSLGIGINLAPVAQPTTTAPDVTPASGTCADADAGS